MLSLALTLLHLSNAVLPFTTEEWNRFRGPNGSGVSSTTEALPVEFDRERNVAWKTELPPGHSSPCLGKDRLFLTALDGDVLQTLCLNRSNGEVLWKHSIETDIERVYKINSPATPTPTTDGERVYIYFGSYGLLCFDYDGKIIWKRELPVPVNTFGTASSLILAKGRLIFCNDQKEGSYLEAIEPADGKTLWKTDRSKFGAGWSTPVLFSQNGRDEILVYGVWWMTAYDLLDGSVLWSVPGLTDEPCTTPIVGGGLIYLTSYNMKTNPEVIGLPNFESLLQDYDQDGDGQLTRDEVADNKSILSRNDADGEGDHPLPGFFRYLDEDRDGRLTLREWDKMIAFLDSFKHVNGLLAIEPAHDDKPSRVVWQHTRGVPECPSPVFHDGSIYMVKNGGILSCLDAASGDLHYQERLNAGGPYYASLIFADGRLYACSARGTITVFSPGDSLEILAQNDLDERIMATPAVGGDRLFVRTENHLFAFSKSPKGSGAGSGR